MLQREHKGKNVIVYPSYFDASLTRRLGRRVSKELAVKDPRPEDIVRAAKRLGLDAYVEEGRYPRVWWRYSTRVVVSKGGYSKREILRLIGEELKKVKK
ncbi:MAG: signal recognition particle subunit SRP19/SEC65 family protein [Desulfurococcales archaeon]|nr:signal recognition particle subunit SRP19/SEC65 family protein [Desulfurococcales archaeon]